jgi:hypothetical protein
MKTLCALFVIFGTTPAFGQGGVKGGGRFSELRAVDFMEELALGFEVGFLYDVFPEVVKWEDETGQSISKFIRSIRPVFVNQKVYDQFGQERDCVSHHENNRRWFECNQDAIPEDRLENQPLLYAMEMHEVFRHNDLEPATTKAIPSEYPLASRLLSSANMSLVTYQKYVPGRRTATWEGTLLPETRQKLELDCRTQDREIYYSAWRRPKGLRVIVKNQIIWVFRYSQPSEWDVSFEWDDDYQVAKYWKNRKKLRRLGRVPKLELLWSSPIKLLGRPGIFYGRYESEEKYEFGNIPKRALQFDATIAPETLNRMVTAKDPARFPMTLFFGNTDQTGSDYGDGPSYYGFDRGTSEMLLCETKIRSMSDFDDDLKLLREKSLVAPHLPFEFQSRREVPPSKKKTKPVQEYNHLSREMRQSQIEPTTPLEH